MSDSAVILSAYASLSSISASSGHTITATGLVSQGRLGQV